MTSPLLESPGGERLLAALREACAALPDPASQDALVRRGPYYRTPYIGQHGWISVDRPLEQHWAEVCELIEDGYRLAAPRRLIDRLERDA